MKNLFYLLAGILLITSCAVNQDVTNGSWIQKRKYTKGFHLSLKSKNDKATKIDRDTKNHESNEELAQITPQKNQRVGNDHQMDTKKEMVQPFASKDMETPSTIEEQQDIKTSNKPTVLKKLPKLNSIKENIANVYKKNFNNAGIASSDVDEDIMLIVGIILCLVLLSPLGVYVVKGGGSDFTLNLLIWLIAILLSILRAAIWTGFGFGYGLAGLVMLLAVVHGILVILDFI